MGGRGSGSGGGGGAPPPLVVRDGYRDVYSSLESLIKTNDGLFKSERQAEYLRSKGNDIMPDFGRRNPDKRIPGQTVITVELRPKFEADRKAMRQDGTNYLLHYVLDTKGVVAKRLIRSGPKEFRVIKTRWKRA